MKTSWRICGLLIITLMQGACSQKAAQVKKYYRLDVAAESVNHSPVEGVLWVKRPEALGVLGNRPMVVTDPNGALQQLSFHHWIDSPKILLHHTLVSHAQQHWELAQGGKPAGFDHTELVTQILSFEKNEGDAELTIKFTWYDAEGAQLKQQLLSSRQPITTDNYAGFADAMQGALADVLSQLEWQP